MTQCRAQVLPRSHPHLGAPTIQRGACGALPTPLPLAHLNSSGRVQGPTPMGSPPALQLCRQLSACLHSRGAKQALLSSPELLPSLPPSGIRCPQLTADPEPHSLGKPAAETTHLQLRGSHRQDNREAAHAQRAPQRASSSLRGQRTVPKTPAEQRLSDSPTFRIKTAFSPSLALVSH